ncbi:MAG: thiamine-phosphate kinase, partial [Phenylobacterium sp.]|nr:thiamine-phosphate kinase [Phenylobacterium sp.]
GGDDYEIVLAAEPAHREVLEAAGCAVVGVFVDGPSEVLLNGRALDVGPGGWRHA